jgi:hypothetical protein
MVSVLRLVYFYPLYYEENGLAPHIQLKVDTLNSNYENDAICEL